MTRRDVLDRLAFLQFPLLFLPGALVTLAVYGSEFGLPSGRVLIALLVGLPLQALLTRGLARRAAASRPAWSMGCVLVALAVTWAYRPLHFDWWDERSIDHALRLSVIGVASLWLSSMGLARMRETARSWRSGLAAALGGCASIWLISDQYPLAMLLGIACVAAAGLASPNSERPSLAIAAPDAVPGRSGWWIVIASLDLSLPVWERSLEAGFGAPVGLALASAAVSVGVTRARPALIATGCCSFAWACVSPGWSLSPWHQLAAGGMLGAALGGLRLSGAGLQPGAALLLFGLGWLLANSLMQNLAFASLRFLLLVPALPFRTWLTRITARPLPSE